MMPGFQHDNMWEWLDEEPPRQPLDEKNAFYLGCIHSDRGRKMWVWWTGKTSVLAHNGDEAIRMLALEDNWFAIITFWKEPKDMIIERIGILQRLDEGARTAAMLAVSDE